MGLSKVLKDLLPTNMKDMTPRDIPQGSPVFDLPTFVQEPDHTHQWEKKFVAYAAPRRDIANTQTLDPEVLQKALMGVTTILWECIVCHMPRHDELLGSDNPQLDDMLDKKEQYGTQYIQRSGVTFQIQKYQPQYQAAGQLPIRSI